MKTTTLILIIVTILQYFLWQAVFYEANGTFYSSSQKVWADWVVHLTHTSTFAYWPVSDWFSENLLMAGKPFTYPFLPNLISGLLLRFGLSLVAAMLVPSVVMGSVLVFSLYFFYANAVGSRGLAWIATGLFLCNGGLGWIQIFNGRGLDQGFTDNPDLGIIVQNFVTSEFLPQRNFLFGATIFFMITGLLIRSLANRAPTTHYLCIGLLTPLLLITHMHSYLILVILGGALLLGRLGQRRDMLIFAGVSAFIGLPVYYAFYANNDVSGFINWAPLALIDMAEVSLLQYVILNFGILVPMLILAIVKSPKSRALWTWVGIFLFVLTHIVQFQPWIWDNTKILTYAWAFCLIPICTYLDELWKRAQLRYLYKFTVFVTIVAMSSAGALEISRLLLPGKRQLEIFPKGSTEAAAQIRTLSSHRDVFLTSASHSGWVHALAARPVYLAYPGWLWSYGLDPEPRKRALREIAATNAIPDEILEQNPTFILHDESFRHEYGLHHHQLTGLSNQIAKGSFYRLYKLY